MCLITMAREIYCSLRHTNAICIVLCFILCSVLKFIIINTPRIHYQFAVKFSKIKFKADFYRMKE